MDEIVTTMSSVRTLGSQGETNSSDNNLPQGNACVTIPSDLNIDFSVALPDVVLLADSYSFRLGDVGGILTRTQMGTAP